MYESIIQYIAQREFLLKKHPIQSILLVVLGFILGMWHCSEQRELAKYESDKAHQIITIAEDFQRLFPGKTPQDARDKLDFYIRITDDSKAVREKYTR